MKRFGTEEVAKQKPRNAREYRIIARARRTFLRGCKEARKKLAHQERLRRLEQGEEKP